MTKRKFHNSELSRLIDETILEFLENGEPSADEVSNAVLERYSDLVYEYGQELAEKYIRSVVSDRMKKTAATKKGHALQLKLNIRFGNLDPDSAITYCDNKGVVRYVATVRAKDEHHRGYIELLEKQIVADTDRLKVEKWFYAWLKPAFDKYPGITTGQAIEFLESGKIPSGYQEADEV